MATLLIIYGTMNGQTAAIAGHMAAAARARGHAVTLLNGEGLPGDLDPLAYDGVIIGGWVRGGQHPAALARFVRRCALVLNAVPSAFFSVSLFAASRKPQHQQRAARVVERFLSQTGWRPAHTAAIAGALRYTRFGRVGRRIVRFIWLGVGRLMGWSPPVLPVDIDRDYEYTDWAAVDRFTAALLADLAPAPVRRAGAG